MTIDLSEFINPTKLKIEIAIEDRVLSEKARTYLGVSSIGHPCARALFYEFRWFLPPEEFTPRQQRLWGRGHREEVIIMADLKEAGVKIVAKQAGAKTCGGHVGAHLDSVLVNIPGARKTPHLGEFKTSATKYFNPLVKSKSVKKSFFSHYCQCQGYMHLFKLKRCLYICVNKEDDRRYYERIKYDRNFAIGLFEKAEEIVMALTTPNRLNEDPNARGAYRCHEKFCRFREICHFPKPTDKPNKNCRTCKTIQVHDKGRWYCPLKEEYRKAKAQLKGCKKWSQLKQTKIIGAESG